VTLPGETRRQLFVFKRIIAIIMETF